MPHKNAIQLAEKTSPATRNITAEAVDGISSGNGYNIIKHMRSGCLEAHDGLHGLMINLTQRLVSIQRTGVMDASMEGLQLCCNKHQRYCTSQAKWEFNTGGKNEIGAFCGLM